MFSDLEAWLSAPTPRWVALIVLAVLYGIGKEIQDLKESVEEMTEKLDSLEDVVTRIDEDEA